MKKSFTPLWPFNKKKPRRTHENNDNHGSQERTEMATQADPLPGPEALHDPTHANQPLGKEMSPLQLEPPKDTFTSAPASDVVPGGSELYPEDSPTPESAILEDHPEDKLTSAPPSDVVTQGSEIYPEDRSTSKSSVPEEQAAQLWNKALDRLRNKSPELVQGYDLIIKNWLASNGVYYEARGRRPSVLDFLETDMLPEERSIRLPFDLVISVMLEEQESFLEGNSGSETESEYESKEEAETETKHAPDPEPVVAGEEQNSTHDANDHSIGAEAAQLLSKRLRKVALAQPQASIAWAVTYITLQSLLLPVVRTDTIQSQTLFIISKMEWFTGLYRLIFWPNQESQCVSPTSTQIDALVALYESILAYHVLIATEFDASATIGRPQPEESRLKLPLEELQACELNLVSTFDQLCLRELFVKQPNSPAAAKPVAAADSELREALAKLGANQQPFPTLNADKSCVLDRLYDWAINTPEFKKFICWNGDSHLRLLWVHGPPGRDKSMLLQAAARRLPKASTSSPAMVYNVAYFFHDGPVRCHRNIVTVLKGLIFRILFNQPELKNHLTFILTERRSFDDEGDAYALSNTLFSMIQDSRFISTYFIVDGIELFATSQRCQDKSSTIGVITGNKSELQCLIATTLRISQKVKWLLSVEDELKEASLTMTRDYQQLSLNIDDNESSALAEFAQEYAAHKVVDMCERPGYNGRVRRALDARIKSIRGNFLFFDMALDIVGACSTPWDGIDRLQDLAREPSLFGLYRWNYEYIEGLPSKDLAYCRAILHTAAAAFHPLLNSELVVMTELPLEVEPFLVIEKFLPAFLEIREEKICFKHSSARDFVRRKMGESVLRGESARLAQKCLRLVLKRLQCSQMKADSKETFDMEFEITITLWVKHFSEFGGDQETVALAVHLLSVHLIDWLEVLAETGLMSEVLYMMTPLIAILEHNRSMTLRQEADSIIQIFREVTTFMISYQRWKALPQEEPELDGSSTVLSPEQRLLFKADLPILREKLLPVLFPMLQIPPALGGRNTWGECLHVLNHRDWVRGCCFSPDGCTIAAATDEGKVCVWDTRTGNLQQVLRGFDDFALGVAISPAQSVGDGGGGPVIAAFDSGTIKLWESATGNLLETLASPRRDGINSSLQSIALSSAADMLAAAVGDSVFVWQLPGSVAHGLLTSGSGETVRRVTFSPDGKLLASTAGSNITIWSTARGRDDPVCTLPPNDLPEKRHVSNQDDAPEATAHPENSETCETKSTEQQQRGHSDEIDGLCFSPDSKFLVSGSDDCTARVWDIDTCKTVAILGHHQLYINDVCFSPDGSWIATGSNDSTIALWKQKSYGYWGSGEKREQPDHILCGHDGSIFSISFSPLRDRLVLASASRDSDVRIWDIDTVSRMMGDGQPTAVSHNNNYNSAVSCVAISLDGRTIASGSSDGMICFWDSQTGVRQRISDRSHEGEILSMAFSSDSQLLVTTSIDRTAYVWKVSGSAEPLVPRLHFKHGDWIRDAQFDREGRLVATGDDDGIVHVYDVSAAKTADVATMGVAYKESDTSMLQAMRTFQAHNAYVYGVAFSPDSKRVASGGGDEHIKIWDMISDDEKGALLYDMRSSDIHSRILDVEFSADGTKVVSVCRDGTVAVWTLGADGNYQCRILEVGEESNLGTFVSIRIDPRFPDFLLTELGAMRVEPNANETAARPPGWLSLSLDKSERVILYNNEVSDEKGVAASSEGSTLIHLPSYFTPNYEPYACRIQEAMVVIGCTSGHVLIFQFAPWQSSTKIEESTFYDEVDAAQHSGN